MKITTKPRKPQGKHVFTEEIDYSKTGRESIWGRGDPDTLKLLDKEKIRGRWLNLAAGDGRYNIQLLEKADLVVASDIDETALDKLYNNTPEEYRQKLELKAFNITEPFPLGDSSFDGILCMGTLHLFPICVLKRIVSEIDRVLKAGGKVILDFAADVKRVKPDGERYLKAGEPQYSLKEAEHILKDLFNGYEIQMKYSKVPEEKVQDYTFSCNFILLVAKKR